MLIPINRATFEQLVPLAATGAQYRYIWGTFADCLRRLLVSFAAVIVAVLVGYFMGETLGPIFQVIAGSIAGCYWLWAPIFLASKTNWDYRRYKYSGFWRGEVLDKFVTDEVVSTGEKVTKRGDLVVTENREKRLNLEIGDDTGFSTRVKVPYKRDHQGIRRGDVAEMIIVSTRPDLGLFAKISDVYVRDSAVWVSNYPYVQRAAFLDVEKRLDQRRLDPRGDRSYPDRSYPDRPYIESPYPNRPGDYYDDPDEAYPPVPDPDEPYPNDPYYNEAYPNQVYPDQRPSRHNRPPSQGYAADWPDQGYDSPEPYPDPKQRRSPKRPRRP